MLFKRILYPTDFSELAETAGEYVLKLKEAGAQEVIILHVIHPVEFSLPQFDDPFALDTAVIYARLPEMERELLNQHRKALLALSEKFAKAGFKVRELLKVGTPSQVIVETASAEGASVIVIGYHGKGLLERILEMGSTAKAVIKDAECPVLVVKRQG
jgi:nucleotide-binding universal stress UspA family protein